MFSLKSGPDGRAAGGAELAMSSSGFVLPRLLRKPARMLSRMCAQDARGPRFGATIATAILFSATGLYGGFVGGQLPGFVQAVTARTGFAMNQVQVVGNKETSEIDVIQEVGLDGWTSLIGFDAAEARERVAALPWVESAAVQKIYPSTLEVRIVEKKPFAIWQHGSELTIVEKDGAPIAPLVSGRHASLPVVIGMGAAEKGAAFVAQVAEYPELASQVVAYSYIAQRRWDLHLRNGIVIKLPEKGADGALSEVVAMDSAEKLFSRDIVSVDMRLADRIFVRLSHEAAEQRAETLKKQLGKEYVRREKAI